MSYNSLDEKLCIVLQCGVGVQRRQWCQPKASRPAVGDTVRILRDHNVNKIGTTKGMIGRLTEDARDDEPFQVLLENKTECWYREGDIETCEAMRVQPHAQSSACAHTCACVRGRMDGQTTATDAVHQEWHDSDLTAGMDKGWEG